MTGTFEGVGTLQFSPDNKYCYAYSGALSVADTNEHQLLSFITNSYYSVVDFSFWRRSPDNDDVAYYVEMNGTQVLAWVSILQEGRGNVIWPLIIPPFTELKAYIDKQTNSTTSIIGINITGKIYGAIEQENLESITNNNKWASL